MAKRHISVYDTTPAQMTTMATQHQHEDKQRHGNDNGNVSNASNNGNVSNASSKFDDWN